MTIPPISIEKSASTLVGIFGDAAPAHARERMDEYAGDVYKDGYKFWLAVAEEALGLLELERVARRRPPAWANIHDPQITRAQP